MLSMRAYIFKVKIRITDFKRERNYIMIVLGMILAVVVAAVAELGAIANKKKLRLIAIFFILGEIRFSIYKR